MTKILKTVCKTIGVILTTIFLSVAILIAIVVGIIGFPITIFASKDIEIKEYFSELRDGIASAIKTWSDIVRKVYAKD